MSAPTSQRTADEVRLLYLQHIMDGVGDGDFHERAAEVAVQRGADEPNDEDYLIAIRSVLDAEIRQEWGNAAIPSDGPEGSDMVPRSRYDACNRDWLEALDTVKQKDKLLTRIGNLLTDQTYTAAVIKALSDDALSAATDRSRG